MSVKILLLIISSVTYFQQFTRVIRLTSFYCTSLILNITWAFASSSSPLASTRKIKAIVSLHSRDLSANACKPWLNDVNPTSLSFRSNFLISSSLGYIPMKLSNFSKESSLIHPSSIYLKVLESRILLVILIDIVSSRW